MVAGGSATGATGRVRHMVKAIALPLLHGSGALWLMNKLHPGERQIALMYHNVDPAAFEGHAAFLHKHATVVDLDAFLASPAGGTGRPLVTITFDDGYASFVRDVVPILTAHKLPATWFVPTALVGTQEVFWFDRIRAAVLCSQRSGIEWAGRHWKLGGWNREYVAAAVSRTIKRAGRTQQATLIHLAIEQLGDPSDAALAPFRPASPDQLRSLDPDIVAIGSHSHTHPQLSQLELGELTEELLISKDRLEKWTGRPIRHFAFPSGDYDVRVVEAIRAAGYRSAWTTEARFRSPADDPYRMPRVSIDDRASVSILAAKMTAAMQHRSLSA